MSWMTFVFYIFDILTAVRPFDLARTVASRYLRLLSKYYTIHRAKKLVRRQE